MKIWSSTEKGDEMIIAYIDQTLCSGNPKLTELDTCMQELKMGKIPGKNFISIPQHYLKEINIEDGKEYIEVLYGADSYEHLKVKDSKKRMEIFDYLKANVPNSVSSVDSYSKVRAGKKPLIAMVLVTLIFLWTLNISIGLESGNAYEVVGSQRSLASVVIGIAALGVKKVILLFGALFGIAAFAFYKKTAKPMVVSKIVVQR